MNGNQRERASVSAGGEQPQEASGETLSMSSRYRVSVAPAEGWGGWGWRQGSEGLHNDGVQQGHVLGSSDGQLVRRVVVDDLGDGGEGGAVLPQHEAAVSGLAELHVHEALTAPDTQGEGGGRGG